MTRMPILKMCWRAYRLRRTAALKSCCRTTGRRRSTDRYAVNVCWPDAYLQTFGENVNVELRRGTPGKSRPVTSQRSRGGHVGFSDLCPGSYFLAIGNEDYVSVTPTRQFEMDHVYSSRITMQRGSGNVSKQSRKSL